MRRDENGYIVVEMIGAFIPFLLLIISILSLINIVTVQSRMHFALTQAANALSMYSYTLEATGVAEKLATAKSHSSKGMERTAEITDDIYAIFEEIKGFSSGGGYGMGPHIADLFDDPVTTVKLLRSYAVSEAWDAMCASFVRPLVGRYLCNGDMDGDTYLRSANVIGGLDGLVFYKFGSPGNSVIMDEYGDIKLVVSYKIEYKFGALPLPLPNPYLEVTQTAKTKAWLSGSGEGYS